MEDFDPDAAANEADEDDSRPNVHGGAPTLRSERHRRPQVRCGRQHCGERRPTKPEGALEPEWADAPSESTSVGSFATTSAALAPKSGVGAHQRRCTPGNHRRNPPRSRSPRTRAKVGVRGAEPEPRRPGPPPSAPAQPRQLAEAAGPRRPGRPLCGASLTLDELCAASGLGSTEVASLEGFGLIEPMVVGGALYYDEEGLTVAKLVADFARFGIEPRHLRLFRNAADRELGLIEQVVTPLLRQRNPEARQRALDAAGELSRLGQALRAAMLRRALRHHLGG